MCVLLGEFNFFEVDLNGRIEWDPSFNAQCARAIKYGYDYFDGDRKYGYGGYNYNPKYWSQVSIDLIIARFESIFILLILKSLKVFEICISRSSLKSS